MECDEVGKLLAAHVDGELDRREAIDIDAHLAGCEACRARLGTLAALRQAVRAGATYHRAPAGLESRITAALPGHRAARRAAPAWRDWRWPQVAGALLTLTAITFSATLLVQRPSEVDRVADEVVASHVRSLLANRAVDVASSDQHTVKPWFAGKVDFTPPVRDLASEGFPLVGGRLDYIGHRPVAALVYRHAQHTINVFVWPGGNADAAAVLRTAAQGYHVLHWSQAGMAFWAVSDVEGTELARLGKLLREAPGPS